MRAGLRVDVDTYRGTEHGVPRLLEILAARGIAATFFFTVGPDNMGRHLWRLLRPAFAWKMLRSRGPGLYGWSILLRGTLWPGPPIGRRLAHVIRSAAQTGHEIGLHAWDHHRWQAGLARMSEPAIRAELRRGLDELARILGRAPTCSAAPGWICNDRALRVKAEFAFRYNSDCRGHAPFRPVVGGRALDQPQLPVSLPTYDEVIGRQGITDANYNEWLLSRFATDGLNVLTIHAEVEGIGRSGLFERFLAAAASRGIDFVPLGELLPAADALGPGRIEERALAGREGPVAVQVSATPGG